MGPKVELVVKQKREVIHEKKVVEKKRRWLARKLIATKQRLAVLSGARRRERTKVWKLWRELQQATAAPSGTLSAGFSGPASTSGGSLVGFGLQMQQEGCYVGEHPAFGGVDGGHAPESYHYRGEAIDISGGCDLERVASEARNAGFNVYWRVPGHFDHVHVDTGPVRPY